MSKCTLRHGLLITATLFGCLLLASSSFARPICELDCNASSSCDQICYVNGTSLLSTCAMYECDEPQFPWAPGLVDSLHVEVLNAEAATEDPAAEAREGRVEGETAEVETVAAD